MSTRVQNHLIPSARQVPKDQLVETAPVQPVPELRLDSIVAQGPVTDGVSSSTSFDRPRIPPPSSATATEWRFLNLMQRMKKTNDSFLETMSVRLEQSNVEIRTLTEEQLQKLKESSQRAQSSNFWSLLKKAATALLSAFSLVMGFSLISAGGSLVIAGAMIGSGMLALANFIMSEAGIWNSATSLMEKEDDERRQRLASNFATAVGIVSGMLGLAGGIGAFATHAGELVGQSLVVLQATLSFFQGVSSTGKGLADSYALWTEAELNEIRSNLRFEQIELDTMTRWLEGWIMQGKSTQAAVKRAARTLMQTHQIVVQG